MKIIAISVIASLCMAVSPCVYPDEVAQRKDVGLTAGMVKKIDRTAGKITIAHEPIEHLGMPKMTMAYGVREPAMLDAVKVGDKINFDADKIDGVYTVTRIKAAK